MTKFILAFSACLYSITSFSGALVVASLSNGDRYSFQFFDFSEAAEFVADRIDRGECDSNLVNLSIKSVYIDGLDSNKSEFGWFPGIGEVDYSSR
jgi:hypothetical protein